MFISELKRRKNICFLEIFKGFPKKKFFNTFNIFSFVIFI